MPKTTRSKKTNQSIDDLNHYIEVIHPGIWLLIIAMLSILVGILGWSFFGHIHKQVEAIVYVESNQATCFVDHDDNENIEIGMTITFSSTTGTITKLIDETDDTTTYLVETSDEIKEGYYQGSITYDEISPISFLLN